MKTEFPRTHLAAVSHFMAVKDIRYYLNGLYVEMLAGETRLVATDGTVLGATRHAVDNAHLGQVIVPAATVALAVKMPGEFLVLERGAGGNWYLAGIPFTPVDGLFPSYRRVIPSTWSGAAGHYNPELLMRFVKAARAQAQGLSDRAPVRYQRRPGPPLRHGRICRRDQPARHVHREETGPRRAYVGMQINS
jgi:hypothetical protein